MKEKEQNRADGFKRKSMPIGSDDQKKSQKSLDASKLSQDKEENDDLIKEMMNDSSIKHVNEEVENEVQKTLQELEKFEDEERKEK